jgi:hypothetical protein
MVHSAFLRRLVLLVLVLPLTVGPSWAAFPAWSSAAREWLSAFSWLSGPAGLDAIGGSPSRILTEKSGCTIDPNGQMHCGPGLTVRPGCTLDRRGRLQCVPIVTPKSGCSIDPNGSPHCTP